MDHLKNHIPELLIVCSLLVLLLAFVLYMAIRTRQCKTVVDEVTTRLDKSKYSDPHFFDHKVLPIFMKMHNPFTFKKPTIENYFTKEFINNHLINQI